MEHLEIKNTYHNIKIHKPGFLYEFSNHKNQIRYGTVLSAKIDSDTFEDNIIYVVEDAESKEVVNVEHSTNRIL